MPHRHPHRPGAGAWTAAVAWAVVPLLTCGLATPFTIGFAAFRLQSKWLVISAALYGACVSAFVIVAVSYEDINLAPDWLFGLVGAGLVASWLGGVIHSGILVPMLVRGRPRPVTQSPPMLGHDHTPHGPMSPAKRAHDGTTHGPVPPMRRQDHTPSGPMPPAKRAHDGTTHGPVPPMRGQDRTHGPVTPQSRVNDRDTQGSVTPGPRVHYRTTHPSGGARRVGEPEWIGHYRVLRLLGRGGQGAVYLAAAPNGAQVAVKVLHDLGNEVARTRFAREVDAARRVATFSTARVLDVSIAPDQAYIVSEFVAGPSLEQLVRERGPRDEDSLTRLALATAGALAAIHKAGIVHRDFKPSNVLIGSDGPRVIDFGIARSLDHSTMSGKVSGTPPYMSPEQLSGLTVGPPSDVFSWAVTMTFAATGRPAFGEDTVPAVFNRVLNLHPDLSPLPPSLRGIVGTALAKSPDDRPSAAEVMLAIVH
ncbi:serine/threonine-protein kinase [Nonomuraea sp. NPDC059194]|uniref:serine/threonine-protein kinase n=1 Tax=Nonomuraea sp. NPDC059194 TaxID=3346764 RepID=UPI00369D8036